MTPRNGLPAIFIAVTAAALLAACGGGGDDGGSSRPGNLTNPRDVPTATPWGQTPEAVILDPNNIQPLPPVGNQPPANGQPGTSATPATINCGDTYKVVSGDTPSGIAEKCGVTTDALLAANPGLDPAALHVGDEINIPHGGQ